MMPSMPARSLVVASLLTVSFLLAGVVPAQAGDRCSEHEARSFILSSSAAARCEMLHLRLGRAAPCRIPNPPACAGDALDDFVDLVFGADTESHRPAGFRLEPQVRCQLAIARASLGFLIERMRERNAGVRSTLKSQRVLERLAGSACQVEVTQGQRGDILPRVGGVCRDLLGEPGDPVPGQALARCLRPALGRIAEAASPTEVPPNILVVMTDDQRWDTLSFMPEVSGRLAAGGIEFTESFVTTSVCCPSRASFFSGLFARVTGIHGNRPPHGGAPLFDSSNTFVTALHDAGYATALYGKYMNATDLLAEPPPGWTVWQAFVADGRNFFDYSLNENGTIVQYGSAEDEYTTDLLRDRSTAFIESHRDQPFFVHYAPFAPHFGASPDSFFSTTPAPRHDGAFDGLAPHRPPSYREADRSDKPPHWRDTPDSYWDLIEATGEHDQFRLDQLESLLAVDEAVAMLLDSLEEQGLTDHTLVVFTSDNGYMWGEHQLTGKGYPYEESIRVPLVVAYPMLVDEPRREDSLVINLDLAPTFLDLAGVPPHADLPGASLAPLLASPQAAEGWRRDFMGEHWDLSAGKFSNLFPLSRHEYVRSREWKYAEHRDPRFFELYHLPSDPYELDNKAYDVAYLDVAFAHFLRLRELLALD
jgi:arylsulfatase A-like enzyme